MFQKYQTQFVGPVLFWTAFRFTVWNGIQLRKMRDFDDILDEIGSFGPFQITVFLLVSIFETPTAWAMFLQVFVAADQPWTCSSLLSYNLTSGDNLIHVTSVNRSLYAEDSFGTAQLCELIANGSCGEILFMGDFTTVISEVYSVQVWNTFSNFNLPNV